MSTCRDMGDDGLKQFVKQFFPQVRKEGMIFDVRYNGGGFVDQLIFERLRRVLAGMDSARNWEPAPFPTSSSTATWPVSPIATPLPTATSSATSSSNTNSVRSSASVPGAECAAFAAIFELMDGGYITRPEFSLYGLDSQWAIENRGVQPDVVVDNPPDLVVKGQDPQLEKAVEMLMQQIKANPKKLPPRPPDLPTYPEGPGL